jgi:hypothetical protein
MSGAPRGGAFVMLPLRNVQRSYVAPRKAGPLGGCKHPQRFSEGP